MATHCLILSLEAQLADSYTGDGATIPELTSGFSSMLRGLVVYECSLPF